MTVQLKTLDQALAASHVPIAPGDLAGRIVTQATAQSQHRANGLLPRRRPRRERRNGRVRRPVILSSIGGGLIAISAVAAALAVDGRLDVSQLAKPVMGLFGAAPTEVVERPVPQARPQSASAAPAEPRAETVAAVPAQTERQNRPMRRLGERFRRIAFARRLQQRRQAARADGAETRPPMLQRRAARLRAGRGDAVISNRPIRAAIRERAADGTVSPTTIGERRAAHIRELRERRGDVTPTTINQRAARAAAIRERLRERRDTPIATSGPAARPANLANPEHPAATQNAANGAPISRSDLIIDVTPPGPEPMTVPDIAPDAPQTPQAEAASGAQRPAARNAAEQRRALRRDRIQRRMRQSDRPRRPRNRPRIPRPRG